MRLAHLASPPLTGVQAFTRASVLLLLLAACSPVSTAPSSLAGASTPSPTPSHTQSFTPASRPGATESAAPSGFPVMPGSDAVAPLPEDPTLVARWTTAANGAQVYDFFVDALPDAGFEIDQLAPGGEAAIIRLTSPGALQLELSLAADGDGTRIDLRLPDAAD
jgi:hypothetical protein